MAVADRIYWLHALTPLHVGGGKGEGYIDLPILREKLTGYPIVPGSSIKGVFADSCGAGSGLRDDPIKRAAFGQSDGNGNAAGANAGALVFTDARLVCLPVRSLLGTFAWCTAPIVLRRFERDLAAAGISSPPMPPNTLTTWITDTSCLAESGKVYLEDLDLDARTSPEATAWARLISQAVFPQDPTASSWQVQFLHRFALLPDDVFGFLTETATDVQPHIRIDPDFKRVDPGALWYEESLPAESILCGLAWCDPPRQFAELRPAIEALLTDRTVQIGGKATTGKGRVQMRFSPRVQEPVS